MKIYYELFYKKLLMAILFYGMPNSIWGIVAAIVGVLTAAKVQRQEISMKPHFGWLGSRREIF